VLAFLDDILVYSRTREEHLQHLRTVLETLRKHKLYAKESKCEFMKDHVEFLGHIIGADGLRMQQEKLDSIAAWPAPTCLDDLRSFLGTAGYYRRFIRDFSRIALPLNHLTKKDTPYQWGEAQQRAFDELKAAMLSKPVLVLPDPSLPYVVTTGSSDYAVGAWISQDQGQGLQPIAFMSHKLTPAEINYAVHEKELLAIVRALEEWRHYLLGANFTVRVLTDHHSLKWLQTQPHLTSRQARWMEFLQQFDMKIEYQAGRMQLLHECHDAPLGGHLGVAKTTAALSRRFYWPRMHAEIRHYVTTCPQCQANKASSQLPAGLLQPLPIPSRPWEQVTMDLITQLPATTEGHNAIVVFVDKLTKMVHLAPLTAAQGQSDAPAIAELFFHHVVRAHGLPDSIVSDRATRFTGTFWRHLWTLLGTKLNMSTAFHPQSDGQTER